MARDEFLNIALRVAAATYAHVQACLRRVPEPARSELRRLAGSLAEHEKLSTAASVIMRMAYDLGIRDEPSLVRINNATVLGAWHSQILDDVIDNKGATEGAGIRNVYLAHIVFNFYCEAWRAMRADAPTAAELGEFTAIELETYAALFDEEARHVGVSLPYDSQRTVASKGAPIKAVLLQILRLTGRHDLESRVFAAIDNCSFALLVADDVVDWEQDFDLQRFTYPIQAAFDRLNLTYRADQHEVLKQKVARTLFFGTLYHELMKDIVGKLEDSAASLESTCPMFAGWLRELGAKAVRTWRRHSRFLYEKAGDQKRAAAG